MRTRKTERGFKLAHFQDHYGQDCSIQESSLATDYCLWLGAHENRMHLTRKMAKRLLPNLLKFIETGRL